MPRECSIPDCSKIARGHGWCSAHYSRWRLHGDPLAGRTPNGEPHEFLRTVALTYEGDECLLWPYWRTRGYGTIWVDGGNQSVSRIVCEERHGPPPTPEHQAAHSCGKGSSGCVTKQHLSWKTEAANQLDKIEHGTTKRGSRCNFVKITEPVVREIRSLAETMSQAAIARRVGLSQSNVSLILSRKRWGWLD